MYRKPQSPIILIGRGSWQSDRAMAVCSPLCTLRKKNTSIEASVQDTHGIQSKCMGMI